MSKYVLGTAAELDLDEIWEYIAQDNVESADRWVGKLFDAFEAIARNPRIGHKRDDLTSHVILFWPVGAYLILYRVIKDESRDCCVNAGSPGYSFVSPTAEFIIGYLGHRRGSKLLSLDSHSSRDGTVR